MCLLLYTCKDDEVLPRGIWAGYDDIGECIGYVCMPLEVRSPTGRYVYERGPLVSMVNTDGREGREEDGGGKYGGVMPTN